VLPSLFVLAAEWDSHQPQIARVVQKTRKEGTVVTYHCFSGARSSGSRRIKERPR